MKIISYNVNGIRSALSKSFSEWLGEENPDVICLQEIKASPDQLDVNVFSELGYHCYWYPAEKKGYSGVAIFSKILPNHVEYGMGIPIYDSEGRMLRLDFDAFSVISVYHPSGSSGEHRQDFKMVWLEDFSNYISKLKEKLPNLVISGDYNICHKEIDIHNPVSNKNSSGFLPEERAWMSKFMESGFIDTFRYFNKEPHQYSWWSFRANSRAKNLGWRIDYNMVSSVLASKLDAARILPDVKHSDHCPVVLELKD